MGIQNLKNHRRYNFYILSEWENYLRSTMVKLFNYFFEECIDFFVCFGHNQQGNCCLHISASMFQNLLIANPSVALQSIRVCNLDAHKTIQPSSSRSKAQIFTAHIKSNLIRSWILGTLLRRSVDSARHPCNVIRALRILQTRNFPAVNFPLFILGPGALAFNWTLKTSCLLNQRFTCVCVLLIVKK